MVLEVLTGLGLAWLYWWEIDQLALVPVVGRMGLDVDSAMPGLHVVFLVHAVFMAAMLTASMIDVDEKTIPDAITVPGTWLGLLAATVCGGMMLPDVVRNGSMQWMHIASPSEWPDKLSWFCGGKSLAVALACWWLWSVSLMYRTWYARHGWRRALQLSIARLVREPSTYWLLAMGTIGSGLLLGVWLLGGASWQGLLSALVGMATTGGIVWIVRNVGSAVLGREAMGFGDVTLMAMIGAILGWQAGLIVFFLAPFVGLVVGMLQVIVIRSGEIAYGPFLCMAAAFAVVRWADVWDRAWPVFEIVWLVPAAIAVCMVLLGVLLAIAKLVVGLFR